jgi:hypothetical protein
MIIIRIQDVKQYFSTLLSLRSKTTIKHLLKGAWTLDANSRVTGAIAQAAWVQANVETSGHIRNLRVEEQASAHTGMVQQVRGNILDVRSGNGVSNWNLVETTILDGVAATDFPTGRRDRCQALPQPEYG